MIINHFAKKEVDLWEEERKREREGEEERERDTNQKSGSRKITIGENNNNGNLIRVVTTRRAFPLFYGAQNRAGESSDKMS